MDFDPVSLRRLRADAEAFRFFAGQPPWYRRTCARWVMSAKREDTRARRLDLLIACSRRGTPIPPLGRAGKDMSSAPSRS